MVKDCFLAALVLCVAAVPYRAPAATHYVDGSGAAADDSGPGTSARPWKTIGRAARDPMPGDVVCIRTGVYRELVSIEKSGTAEKPICFRPDTASRVIVSGADVITGWRKEEVADRGPGQPGAREGVNLFSVDWPHSFIGWSPQHTHPGDPAHRVNRDLADPATIVEASVREGLWDCRGDHLVTRGLRFRYAANRAQLGAARFSGSHDIIEDCTFERTNSIGAAFLGPDIVVRRSTFQDNGQMGFGAGRAHRLLFTGCLVEPEGELGIEEQLRMEIAGHLRVRQDDPAPLPEGRLLHPEVAGLLEHQAASLDEGRSHQVPDERPASLLHGLPQIEEGPGGPAMEIEGVGVGRGRDRRRPDRRP